MLASAKIKAFDCILHGPRSSEPEMKHQSVVPVSRVWISSFCSAFVHENLMQVVPAASPREAGPSRWFQVLLSSLPPLRRELYKEVDLLSLKCSHQPLCTTHIACDTSQLSLGTRTCIKWIHMIVFIRFIDPVARLRITWTKPWEPCVDLLPGRGGLMAVALLAACWSASQSGDRFGSLETRNIMTN